MADLASPAADARLAGARPDRSGTHVYLVGGGIASLAAAAFLIRDGHLSGCQLTVFESADRLGGSLDATGSPETGYVMRGGRMLEGKYQCTYGLFSSIPTLDKSRTVTQEIQQWSEVMKTQSKARLVRSGRKIDTPWFGLSERHILRLERLAIEPEVLLGASSIEHQFDASFFETNFWLMWCTTFPFQPWHSMVEFKRCLVRFLHLVDGLNQLQGVMRTVYNQQESMVRPLQAWLDERAVDWRLGCTVTQLGFDAGAKRVDRIVYQQDGEAHEQLLGPDDLVIVTLGSMTEASGLGAHDQPAPLKGKRDGGAWMLWEQMAQGRPELGRPSAFADHVDESKWMSFTGTAHDRRLFDFLRDFTGNVPGEGGLVTLADSAWRMSVVLPHQPHFVGQPADVQVFWGYGLRVDRPGDFVAKPMADCNGREILAELLGHLRIAGDDAAAILDSSIVRPCMMPFVGSPFLRREKGDRPQVVPPGWRNLGLVGQFVELPDDVVFTVEYSVRSAQAAVARLLDLPTEPPPVYKGQFEPGVLDKAFKALQDAPR